MGVSAEVLVVGAGLAGAAAARALADAGLRVHVLDKGRGPGGRLSTRRAAAGAFDHGASSLQASGDAFREWLQRLERLGVLSDAAEGEWVGRAGMNAVVAHLLDGLAPQWSAAVASLDLMEDAWHALGADGEVLATAPCVVLAVPAPQARAMLASTSISRSDPRRAAAFAGMLEALDGASYTPCWAGIISTNPAAYAGPIAPRLRPSGEVAALIAHESAKPSRAPGHWVLHATADWSTRHLELSADELALPLRDAFCSATGIPPAEVLSVVPHRWRYALPRVGVAHSGLPACGLHLAGDIIGWQAEALIPPAEHAWTSGLAAAGAVIRRRVAQPKS